MKKTKRTLSRSLMTLFAGCILGSAAHGAMYQEKDGLVIIEAENTTSALGEWGKKTDRSGYTGSGYLEFTGNNPESGPAKSPLTYEFKIQKAGLYMLGMHCGKEKVGDRNDVANDCYVKVQGDYGAGPNAGDNHGDDAPLDMLKSNTKFFGGTNNGFGWAEGRTLDAGGHNNKRKPIYDFKAGETYTLVISGRSQLFKLNRIYFRHTSVPSTDAQDLTKPETLEGTETDTTKPTVSITSPANNAVVTTTDDLVVAADITDNVAVLKARFFLNGTFVGAVSTAPYNYNFGKLEAGTHTITVEGVDTTLNRASKTVTVTAEEQSSGSEGPHFLDHNASQKRLRYRSTSNDFVLGTGTGDWFKWEKINLDATWFYLQHVPTGKRLGSTDSLSVIHASGAENGNNVLWKLVPEGDWNRLVHKASGNYLHITEDGAKFQLGPTTWQGNRTKWKVTKP